ncbi:hypothetical protein D9V37_08295 [Nocardioides mangrovicus]|uniref:Uncharacterized protein n=1 Tax=Nocardioides mangrovicus TaxID=2478913 RepID=A0A3L8P4B2_9ACTN|nr:hypothetical protein [Nocardioides mangrovicus]RLV49877.1 hypothetical protein D9V37_08295 [Nocardioides mangrovicus]
MTRVYIPLTLAGLADLQASGTLAPPLRAHAVTDAVREEWAGASEEEWEYEALNLAADDCPPGRRVVVAADVSVVRPDDPEDPTLVVVEHEVPLRRVAAVHADLTEVDATQEEDLRWFATQEIPDLL